MQRFAQRNTTIGLDRPVTRILHVCVVDPQKDDYPGWQAMAEAGELQLKFVASAEEGLRFSRANAVDLWVINTELPGLSGFELCSMLKNQSPDVSVYLVADEYTAQAERESLQRRATLFGCKPGQNQWLRQWIAHSPHTLPVSDCGRPRTNFDSQVWFTSRPKTETPLTNGYRSVHVASGVQWSNREK